MRSTKLVLPYGDLSQFILQRSIITPLDHQVNKAIFKIHEKIIQTTSIPLMTCSIFTIVPEGVCWHKIHTKVYTIRE